MKSTVKRHEIGDPTLSPYDWLMTRTDTRKSSKDYEASASLVQLLLQVEYRPYFDCWIHISKLQAHKACYASVAAMPKL